VGDNIGNLHPKVVEAVVRFYMYLKMSRDAAAALKSWEKQTDPTVQKMHVVYVIKLLSISMLWGFVALSFMGFEAQTQDRDFMKKMLLAYDTVMGNDMFSELCSTHVRSREIERFFAAEQYQGHPKVISQDNFSVEANCLTRRIGLLWRHSQPVRRSVRRRFETLFEAGAMLGERLMPELVKLLDGPAVSYGKGAIVGVAGEMEHGGACVHPMLGKPMRAAIGGGKAVIGSNVKVAAAGAVLDVPLGHKDDSWSFPHFDTITVFVADAPRPDEILVAMTIADGGRLRNRCGTEPIR
jgi:hypothetical protein